MKRMLFILSVVIISSTLSGLQADVFAQRGRIPPSLKATTHQRIGINTDITIEYSRPGVKGRTIWGELVPYGMAPPDRYSDDPYPWRAGANENTTMEFSTDVLVEGKELSAGKYGIHMLPGEKEWIVIFSSNNSSWGSYSYNKDEDVLRITVSPVSAPHQEWLMYGFENLAGSSATCYLHWEKLKLPISIQVK